jgi:eukaryotic-like serine/threonine-protein kinase
LASPVDGVPVDDDGLPLPGAVLGAYVLEHRLGQGGMAAVFAGRHRALGKRVAIKMLLPHNAARAEIARRFVREGEAAARLDHPHVVGVSDVGTDARGAPFLVMEYLDGEDLGALLKRRGRLDVEQTADLLIPVLSAVAAAHDAGIVHRDLKPQNIFLARERNEVVPKVLDFGISKLLDGDNLDLTGTGAILGTPYYISPEQAQGVRKLDARTDQFSLGVIMYECVTGKRPFDGSSLYSVIANIVSVPHAPPRKLVHPLEPRFEAIVNRALAKDPGARFADARAFGRALLPFASFRVRLSHAPEFGGEALDDDALPQVGAVERGGLRPRLAALPAWARSGLLAGALFLLALTIGLATYPHAPSKPRTGPPPLFAEGAPERARQWAATASQPHVGEQVRSAAASAQTPAPRSYRVTLRAQPASARLSLDGQDAGTGSLSRELPIDGAEHLVEASAPGHRGLTVRFRDAPPERALLVLERTAASKTRRALTPSAQAAESSAAPTPLGTGKPKPGEARRQYGTNQAAIVR